MMAVGLRTQVSTRGSCNKGCPWRERLPNESTTIGVHSQERQTRSVFRQLPIVHAGSVDRAETAELTWLGVRVQHDVVAASPVELP
jgi:hypothetical protein